MKKVTVAIAGLLFVAVALATFASAADVIKQNIGSTVEANGGHVNVNAFNVVNAGPGSIVNQTISQLALSKFSEYYKLPSSSKLTSSISQIASNVANAGAASTVNQQISQVALSKSSESIKVPSSPSSSPVSNAKTHLEPPKEYDIENRIPTMVYFSNQMQPLPYSQYQTYSPYMGSNSLWIQGTTSWTQYTQAPQGSSLSLLASSSTGGNGYLYEISSPDRTLSKDSFYFYPGSSQINFYADTIGQHLLLFIIDNTVSNSVVVDVVPLVFVKE